MLLVRMSMFLCVVFLGSSWYEVAATTVPDINRILDYPCRPTRTRRETGNLNELENGARLQLALIDTARAVNETLTSMVAMRNIDADNEMWPFVQRLRSEDVTETLQNHEIVWQRIAINFYHYASTIHQLATNERYWTRLGRGQVSFEPQLRSLLVHRMTPLACHLTQVPRSNQQALDELKSHVKSIEYRPTQSHSVIDSDKMAYMVLNTFLNDYLHFCLGFLGRSAIGQ